MNNEQSEGDHEKNEDGTKLVCKLNISSHGLEQASKYWYDRLKNILVEENIKQSKSDYCLYVRKERGKTIYVFFGVDDITDIVASSNLEQIQELKKNFRENFKMEEGREIIWVSALRKEKGPGPKSLDQEQVIEDLLVKQGMCNCKSSKSYFFTDKIQESY